MDFDDAYANGAYIDQAETFPPKWAALAQEYRANALCNLDIPYGASPRQVLDVFHPSGASQGTVVFVHGGYWMDFDKSFWSHLAKGANENGWTVAVPSYDLCPDVGIAEITMQISAALRQISLMTSGPLRLTGHSAGGHLVARMVDPRLGEAWQARVDRNVPISPLGDLEPLMQTEMNAVLGLDAARAQAESPIHQLVPDCDVTVWVGADERPAFRDQAAQLAEIWNCDLTVASQKHHFDVIDDLADANSELVQLLVK